VSEFVTESDAGIADGQQKRVSRSVSALKQAKSGPDKKPHAHQSALKLIVSVDADDNANAAGWKIEQAINFLGSRCHVFGVLF